MELFVNTYKIFLSGFFERIISVFPLIIVLVVLLLAFLWYHQVKNMRHRKTEDGRSRKFGVINPVIMLGIITLLVLMLLALPFFFEKLEEYIEEEEGTEVVIEPQNIDNVSFILKNMESAECRDLLEDHLKAHVAVKMAETSGEDNSVRVVFDSTRIDKGQLKKIIEVVGFKVDDKD